MIDLDSMCEEARARVAQRINAKAEQASNLFARRAAMHIFLADGRIALYNLRRRERLASFAENISMEWIDCYDIRNGTFINNGDTI